MTSGSATEADRGVGRGEVREAILLTTPVLLAILPFGIIFGAFAHDARLTLIESLGLSGAIYAGASQLVVLQLVALGTPLWSVLIAVVAVNFRHVLYSASLGRHLSRFDVKEKALAFYLLVDPVFAAAEQRSRTRPVTKRFYFAFAGPIYVGWLIATAVGYLFGALIGDQRAIGLDILLPVYFLALTIGFRTRVGFLPVFAASALASVVVYLTLGSPWHVTIGGLFGIAAAVLLPPVKPAAASPDGGRVNEFWLLVVLAAVLTYGTRVAGHLLLSRLETIPPRLDAALNAVPPAMLVTLVVPTFVDGGWLERGVIVVAGLLSLRLSVLKVTFIGVALIAVLRQFGL